VCVDSGATSFSSSANLFFFFWDLLYSATLTSDFPELGAPSISVSGRDRETVSGREGRGEKNGDFDFATPLATPVRAHTLDHKDKKTYI
jgi:hypothetical protein